MWRFLLKYERIPVSRKAIVGTSRLDRTGPTCSLKRQCTRRIVLCKSNQLQASWLTICKEFYEEGNYDFAISEAGRLSSALGGLSAQAIRNVTGERYRTLTQAWEKFAAATNRRPSVRPEPGVAGDAEQDRRLNRWPNQPSARCEDLHDPHFFHVVTHPDADRLQVDRSPRSCLWRPKFLQLGPKQSCPVR